MCEALRELMKDEIEEEKRESEARGKAKGQAEGIISFSLDLGYSKEDISAVLQRKLGISKGQAEDYMEQYFFEIQH